MEVNNQYPADWLKELGAVRPMTVGSEVVFVLGKWHKGYYPIEFTGGKEFVKNGKMIETPDQWRLFGQLIEGPLTRAEVEAILEQLR